MRHRPCCKLIIIPKPRKDQINKMFESGRQMIYVGLHRIRYIQLLSNCDPWSRVLWHQFCGGIHMMIVWLQKYYTRQHYVSPQPYCPRQNALSMFGEDYVQKAAKMDKNNNAFASLLNHMIRIMWVCTWLCLTLPNFHNQKFKRELIVIAQFISQFWWVLLCWLEYIWRERII